MPTWSSSSDWNSAQSESGVVHESVSNTGHSDATIVKQGYSYQSPLHSGNLIGYYPMHEGSGSTANDFSGSKNDGTYNGPSLQSTNFLGNSVPHFDGSDNMDLGGQFSNLESGSFTITGWMRLDSNTSQQPMLDHESDRIQLGYDMQRAGGTGGYGMLVYDGNFQIVTSSVTDINEWKFLAGVADGSTIEFYLGSETSNVSSQGTDTYGTIGSRDVDGTTVGEDTGDSGENINGDVTEIRIYDTALSQSQITDIFNVAFTAGTITTASKVI